jgi:AcrR family transcriptional regulator
MTPSPAARSRTSNKSVRSRRQENLILTAERLFAEHGLDGVALRQISAAAGNGNNSAVHYHFGSKESLVQAIFEYRLPALNERRQELLDERDPDDLRGWVECFILPIMELAERRDSHYVTFVVQLRASSLEYPFDRMPKPFVSFTNHFFDQFRAQLPQLPEPLRSARIGHALTSCLHASADRERGRARKAPRLPFLVHSSDLVDGLVGFLDAPVSNEALTALEAAEIPTLRRHPIP